MIKEGKVNLFLISGRAGSGKDTAAKFIANTIRYINFNDDSSLTFRKYKFAAVVKEVAHLIGWNGQKTVSGRRLLQNIGDAGRDYNSYTWALKVRDEILSIPFPVNVAVISDWRYLNEAEMFVSDPIFNVVTLRISGRNEAMLSSLAEHSSETSLTDEMEYDFVVDNSGSLDEFEKAIANIVLGRIDAKV